MQKLFCGRCGRKENLPTCCGFPMRATREGLQCVRCAHRIGRERITRVATPCCGQPMTMSFSPTGFFHLEVPPRAPRIDREPPRPQPHDKPTEWSPWARAIGQFF